MTQYMSANPAAPGGYTIYCEAQPDNLDVIAVADDDARYLAAIAARAVPASYAEKIAAGITVASAGTPAIDGTYALDDVTQGELAAIAGVAGFLGTFAGGATTLDYPAQDGTPMTFPSIDVFKAFFSAYTGLVAALRSQLAIGQAGGTPEWPSQSVDIA